MTTPAPLSIHPRAIISRNWRGRHRAGLTKAMSPVHCAFCNARDARDAAHARGCPSLAPGSFASLHALALEVETGWAEARWMRLERAQQRALSAAAPPHTMQATT